MKPHQHKLSQKKKNMEAVRTIHSSTLFIKRSVNKLCITIQSKKKIEITASETEFEAHSFHLCLQGQNLENLHNQLRVFTAAKVSNSFKSIHTYDDILTARVSGTMLLQTMNILHKITQVFKTLSERTSELWRKACKLLSVGHSLHTALTGSLPTALN